ncbi:cysteine hydrolase [Candidatus Micrarchaeota archaeon]|nr:cysteine hydrolase [Candidatus Micrarchaeota archaeon]
MATALIIIDVQNRFMNEFTRHLPARILDFVSKNKFDFVLFIKFVNNNDSGFVKNFGWNECALPPETDIAPELAKLSTPENTFEKNTFSAFKSKRSLDSLGLPAFLKKNSVSHVFLCGTDSEACVLASAFDAFDSGFKTAVIKELCASCNGKKFSEMASEIIGKNLERAPSL